MKKVWVCRDDGIRHSCGTNVYHIVGNSMPYFRVFPNGRTESEPIWSHEYGDRDRDRD